MRSRKALAVAIMLLVVVVGGGAVGLTGSFSQAPQPATQSGISRPSGASQGLQGDLNSLRSSLNGGARSPFSPAQGGPMFQSGAATTVVGGAVVTATVTAVMSST